MAELPELVDVASGAHADLDLFMTVVKVSNWPAMVAWYRDTLGMTVALLDDAHEFALLTAGGGRLGLQGWKPGQPPVEPTNVRLVFHVRDVDAERIRLLDRGVKASLPIDNLEEGFREVRFHDPEGNPLTLFSNRTTKD